MPAFLTRIVDGNRGVRAEFPAPGQQLLCKSDNIAFASITEIDGNGTPFLGSAIMTVNNVTTFQNKVIVRCEIDWDKPLRARVSLWVP